MGGYTNINKNMILNMNSLIRFELLLELIETKNQNIIRRLSTNNSLTSFKNFENQAYGLNYNSINNPFWFIIFLKDSINIRYLLYDLYSYT